MGSDLLDPRNGRSVDDGVGGWILKNLGGRVTEKFNVFGGEGLFLATLSGVGDVWLQSLPFNRLADRVLANLTPGGSDGEGSLIGGLSNIFERR